MAKNKKQYIICEDCKKRIDLQVAEELGNIETVANVRVVYCECGCENYLYK